ncbi:MAG: glucose 1-dehydrogenase [Pseudomonadota bacterium]
MGRFEGKRTVVTGGASGIGEATVRALIADGGQVVIADLQEERGAALVKTLGGAAVFERCDVCREADVEAAISRCVERFGGIDGMVNNAGVVGAVGSILETSAESFDQTMSILARGVFFGIKHAGLAMRAQGSGAIVSLASTAGLMGGLGPHVYTMAKHGVVGLTKSAASEFAPLGIRVNAIAPGGTVTPMTNALGDDNPETTAAVIASASPLGIACYPEDIAAGILYLLSEEARYVTGHTLVVDSGVTTAAGAAASFYQQEADTLLHAGNRASQGD